MAAVLSLILILMAAVSEIKWYGKCMGTNLSSEEVLYLTLRAISCEFSEEEMYALLGEITMGEIYEEY